MNELLAIALPLGVVSSGLAVLGWSLAQHGDRVSRALRGEWAGLGGGSDEALRLAAVPHRTARISRSWTVVPSSTGRAALCGSSAS